MNYYDQIAEGYNELHSEEQLNKIEIIKQNIDIKKTDLLLDVGCGTGISTLFNCNAIGIDPSFELIKQGKDKIFINAQAENLPFKDNSFDIVISVTAIQNFKDIKKGIQEIYRVAKGKVVISTLKKSSKTQEIKEMISKTFNVIKEIDEDKDIIIFAEKNG